MEYDNEFVGLNLIDLDSTNNCSTTTTLSDTWYN